MGIVTSIRKYKNTLSKNVTILEGKKHFWDIKFKIKARVYPSFKQHLITFWDKADILGYLGYFTL